MKFVAQMREEWECINRVNILNVFIQSSSDALGRQAFRTKKVYE